MVTALLLYVYSRGVYFSRRIAQGCEQRLDFMALTAMSRKGRTSKAVGDP